MRQEEGPKHRLEAIHVLLYVLTEVVGDEDVHRISLNMPPCIIGESCLLNLVRSAQPCHDAVDFLPDIQPSDGLWAIAVILLSSHCLPVLVSALPVCGLSRGVRLIPPA